ncbi:MAG: hypothetical protein LBE57_06695 [Methanosarcinales archaeon]|nr:hypothetical protein [Methanosarcinales archaeon]
MFAALPPASAEEQRNILVSEEYRILRDGEALKLAQGYEVVLRGFGPDAVLVEIDNNFRSPLIVGSIVVREGETIQCYRILENGSVLILMMTLDKLYISHSEVVAGFSHIYQFEDENTRYTEETEWTLETVVLDDPAAFRLPTDAAKNGSIEQGDTSSPLYIILSIGFAAAAVVVIGFFFRKRVGKEKKSKKTK